LECQISKLPDDEIKKQSKVLQISTAEALYFKEISQIIYLRAEGNYSRVFMKDGTSILVSKTLKHFSRLLSLDSFAKPHQSFLVNFNFISKITKKEAFKLN